ncbi:MAG: tetratricopeptide repeat protein, partial [Desulfovibrionaceae bacterium]|nr:tetratricopeptide repeat protein [Desulfovibrionaceae bacterium]
TPTPKPLEQPKTPNYEQRQAVTTTPQEIQKEDTPTPKPLEQPKTPNYEQRQAVTTTPQEIQKEDTPTPKPLEQPKSKAETPKVETPKKETPKKEATHHGSSTRGEVDKKPTGLVQEKPAEEKEGEKEERPTIYVDEHGNPVEKPLDISALIKDVQQLLEVKQYDDALVILNKLRESQALDANRFEEVLYYISDCLWFRYEKDLFAGYDDIVSATNEALNNNVRSKRAPDALLRLALVNAAVGNIEESRAYMAALLRRFPAYPGNSVGLTALGKEELKKNLNSDAEKSFTTVLDKYPESSQLQAASVGLITACARQQKYDRARLILDFVNKRWPRHYIEEPEFLLVQDDIAKHFKENEVRLQTLWEFINLLPHFPKIPNYFLQMGDIYLKAKNEEAANFLYERIIKEAPDSKEALTARLRLAEKGFYESPLQAETLNHLFGRGSKPPFWELYADISKASNTYPDSILARIKLAQWYLWDRQYIEAMGRAANFIDDYPEHPEKKLAEDIIWQAFKEELKNSLAEENYGRILVLWNGFPLVRKRYGEPDSKLRYALAQGQRERGDEESALLLLKSFLKSPMDPDYGEIAFLDFFNKYLQEGDWTNLLDLGKRVASWDLKPQLRNDLDYAMALAAQNLNLQGTSLALWQKIAAKPDCPLYQKAWAMVFLAQNAERKKDINQAYDFNKKVVDLFKQLQEERSDKADPERIKNAITSLMDICEVANRIPEALQWVNRYREYVKEQSPEYPSLRFREARLYRKLGDTNRSKALLEEITRYYPKSPYASAAESELKTFNISRDLQSFQD